MNDPHDPLNRPLPYMNLPGALPEWVHPVTTVLMFIVGIMAVFFTLIFIVALFRSHDDPRLQRYVHRHVHKATPTPKRCITLRDHR
jgi:hypothetical protein